MPHKIYQGGGIKNYLGRISGLDALPGLDPGIAALSEMDSETRALSGLDSGLEPSQG